VAPVPQTGSKSRSSEECVVKKLHPTFFIFLQAAAASIKRMHFLGSRRKSFSLLEYFLRHKVWYIVIVEQQQHSTKKAFSCHADHDAGRR
jgi:hypothetical protein